MIRNITATKFGPNALSADIAALSSKSFPGKSAKQINNGSCEEFAKKLKAVVYAKYGATGFIYTGSNFIRDTSWHPDKRDKDYVKGFDVAKLKVHWPKCKPILGTTWESMYMDFASYGHAWFSIENRHYDAECPQGTDNFFELPIYVRMAERVIRERK